jgi:hypothetical protein
MGRSRHAIVNLAVVALASMAPAVIAPPRAQAEVRITIVATDPAGTDVTLGRGEPFYVRVEYATDEPITIWARPFFQGREVATMTNASHTYSGQGHALGWFSLDKVSEVDEVRIRVGGGRPYRSWEVTRYPVKVIGTGGPAAARAKAPWVDELLRAEEILQRQAHERRMAEPVSATDTLLMSGFMLVVLGLLVGGFVAPAWGLWKWRGGWRMAAAVPAVLMAFVVLRIVVDTAHDPTSHNLWPFEILQNGTISLVIMAALKIARRVSRAKG